MKPILGFWSDKPPRRPSLVQLAWLAKLSRQGRPSLGVDGHNPVLKKITFSKTSWKLYKIWIRQLVLKKNQKWAPLFSAIIKYAQWKRLVYMNPFQEPIILDNFEDQFLNKIQSWKLTKIKIQTLTAVVIIIKDLQSHSSKIPILRGVGGALIGLPRLYKLGPK